MTLEHDAKFEEKLVVWKMTWGIWQIFTRAHEFLKIWTFIGSFYARKCMSLKLKGELCVMTMKNDAKFEIELTCHFKIDMRNLTNFDLSTQKSQKSALQCWPKNVSAKQLQRSYIWLHSKLIQSLKENWLVLPKIDIRNLANFHPSTQKSQKSEL